MRVKDPVLPQISLPDNASLEPVSKDLESASGKDDNEVDGSNVTNGFFAAPAGGLWSRRHRPGRRC